MTGPKHITAAELRERASWANAPLKSRLLSAADALDAQAEQIARHAEDIATYDQAHREDLQTIIDLRRDLASAKARCAELEGRAVGPWVDCNVLGNGVRMAREGMWRRSMVRHPVPQDRSACVIPSTPGPGWVWSIGYGTGESGIVATVEEAKAAADKALVALGYSLQEARAALADETSGETQ